MGARVNGGKNGEHLGRTWRLTADGRVGSFDGRDVAGCPGFQRGGEKNLYVCFWKHDCSDIPSLEHHAPTLAQIPLELEKKRAHTR